MKSVTSLAVLLLLAMLCASAPSRSAESKLNSQSAQTGAQWIVVTAPAFLESLAPLIAHRRSEGFHVRVVETANVLSVEQIRVGDGETLRGHLSPFIQEFSGPSHILLAGAVTARDSTAPERFVVPTLTGSIARMKGQPTDYGYGSFDEGVSHRTAVGRFPARSPDEMKAMVLKTLKFEKRGQTVARRNRLLVVQGNPGGGSLAELFVQQTTTSRLKRLHPAWNLQMLSHLPLSPFYVPTAQLNDRTTEYLEAGQLFSVYLGHSSPGGLFSLTTRFLSSENWSRLNMKHGQGIFFTCGCFACQWDVTKGDAYGVAAMRNGDGPVAVIGATGESFAAPGLLAVDGLIKCLLQPPFSSRLADYWLSVQEALRRGEIDNLTFSLFDMSDGTSGKVPLSIQREEHLEMWTLLGDPALRLPLTPLNIELNVTDPIESGNPITIAGTLPKALEGAVVRVSLERPIGSPPADLVDLKSIPVEDANAVEQAVMANLHRANNTVLITADTQSKGSQFACELRVPSDLDLIGPTIVVRAHAETGSDAAMGVVLLSVSRPPATK